MVARCLSVSLERIQTERDEDLEGPAWAPRPAAVSWLERRARTTYSPAGTWAHSLAEPLLLWPRRFKDRTMPVIVSTTCETFLGYAWALATPRRAQIVSLAWSRVGAHRAP